jgi:hypothetical protein
MDDMEWKIQARDVDLSLVILNAPRPAAALTG